MKPKPISSMHAPIAAGVQVDPRADRLEHVRRPRQAGRRATAVLGHGAAGAAAISAAVVETLNVRRPPPVPAVSSRSVPL